MGQQYRASRQWERIQDQWITDGAAVDLTNLKSDPRNFKLALWDPSANGVRYLKALIYHLGMGLSAADLDRIRRTPNRAIGDPISVRCRGERLSMDDLQSSFELGAVEQDVALDGAEVLEIGAGYGRTCHMMMANHDVSGYLIVDLRNTLQLSRAYLRAVLSGEQFQRVRFVEVDEVEDLLEGRRFDLCVNIHSMTEMSPGTVRAYLDLIDRTCAAFYTKNPVGKFLDESLDGTAPSAEAVRLALENGPLRQVVDIHDSEAVEAAVPGFVEGYRPGDDWACVSAGRALPWSYLWQAVYRKTR